MYFTNGSRRSKCIGDRSGGVCSGSILAAPLTWTTAVVLSGAAHGVGALSGAIAENLAENVCSLVTTRHPFTYWDKRDFSLLPLPEPSKLPSYYNQAEVSWRHHRERVDSIHQQVDEQSSALSPVEEPALSNRQKAQDRMTLLSDNAASFRVGLAWRQEVWRRYQNSTYLTLRDQHNGQSVNLVNHMRAVKSQNEGISHAVAIADSLDDTIDAAIDAALASHGSASNNILNAPMQSGSPGLGDSVLPGEGNVQENVQGNGSIPGNSSTPANIFVPESDDPPDAIPGNKSCCVNEFCVCLKRVK